MRVALGAASERSRSRPAMPGPPRRWPWAARCTARFRLLAVLPIALLVALGGACSGQFASHDAASPLHVTLLAFNDFHGNLETPAGAVLVRDPSDPARANRVPAGGAAYLATLVRQLGADNPNHAVVAAGDLIGASPLTSALQRDEPTIDALDALGLEASAVGNHEFDRGLAELRRMQYGGCRPGDDCAGGGGFAGARFRYLAANVVDARSGERIFPPYFVKRFDGVPVAFVGVVTRDTPRITGARGVAGLRFVDEAEAVNALVPELRRQGIEAIVVLIHEGGQTSSGYSDQRCENFEGEIVDIAQRLDSAVDVIVSGHTHRAYVCRIGGRLVTQAGAYGRFLTRIDLTIDRQSQDVTGASARNHVVDAATLAKDPATALIVERAQAATSHISDVRVGALAAEISRIANRAGESALGDVVADSQLAATAAPDQGAAQFALMNPGGIRADLVPHDGVVIYGDLFAVLPFQNNLVVVELTGAQIARLLEEQWSATSDGGTILQVSQTFSYSWDRTRPVGARIVPGTIKVNGVALAPGRSYRVAVNSFMAAGGDGLTTLQAGIRRAEGPLLRDALGEYLRAHPDLRAPALGRISQTQ